MKKFLKSIFMPKTGVHKLVILAVLLLIAGLKYLGYLDPAISLMQSEQLTLKTDDFSLSLYAVLKGLFVLFLLFWLSSFLSSSVEKTLNKIIYLKPSNRALLLKAFQTALYILTFLLGLNILGIDLTVFAVFGGALGIGIGFGLQKITSNFISGIILLFEKSAEEGDLVELTDGIYGYVRQTTARYTLIETLENKEIMVPNEDFITSRVTNWTYTNSKGRVESHIGVSYESDIELARTLILDAAKEHPRCCKDPEPQCYLREYGDSSVNFTLYFWIEDITQGRLEPLSDVLRSIWKKFKENNISIPYPQRDITIKNPEVFK